MNAPLTVNLGFREGSDYPSPVTRVLALGYYDGPTEGVLQVGPSGGVYRFAMTDEFPGEGTNDTDLRSFTLSPLPPGSLDALVDLLAKALALSLLPDWSVWVPVWRFPSSAIQKEVEGQVDGLLQLTGPPVWQVTTDDLFGMLRNVKRLGPGAGTHEDSAHS
ncbi:MAG TPA: hypothetical protein VKA46_36705 [Gemmataceae bacterium]|nr:hypothetical protein [Gemmataceae bacterium]